MVDTVKHSSLVAPNNHRPFNNSYADTAERLADTSLTIANMYEFAIQTDDDSMYMLSGVGPNTWVNIAAGTNNVTDASNAGSGTSIFYQKNLQTLEFNAIKSENDRLTVFLDATRHDIELTINEGNIVHQNLSGAGLNSHEQIDSALSSFASHLVAAGSVHGVTGNVVGTSDVQSLSNKTLVTPTIADFQNALHDHSDSAGGGAIATEFASLTLTPAPAPAYTEGLLAYDSETKTFVGYNDIPDVTLNFGEEQWVRVVNNTGTPLSNGDVVFVDGAQGNRPTVAKALADTHATSHSTLAIITQGTIADNAEGIATTFGIVRGIDTSSFSDGDELFLSAVTPGLLVNVRPSSPNYIARIGWALNSTISGMVFVNIKGLVHADLVFIDDAGSIITATDTEGALQENRTAIDLNTAHRSSDGSSHTFLDQSVISGSNPAFGSPTITSFVNSNHDHSNASSGGLLNHSVVGGLTSGSVVFGDATGLLSQDNSGLFWNDTTKRLGIGTNTPTDRVGIQSAGGTSIAQLGATLLTNGDFATDLSSWTAGAGWSWSTETALHTAGNTETLTQGISVTSGQQYQVEVTVSGRTAGSITATLPGSVETAALSTNATHTFTFKAVSTGTLALTFTPTTDFDGALDDVSFKLITPASTYDFSLYDTTGARSGMSSITGLASQNNQFVGLGGGRYNTTGSSNSAQGYQSLYYNTTGISNSAQGYQSLYYNTTGIYNSAQGLQSLFSNTTGSYNSAQGYRALYSNTTGSYNSAQGLLALFSNTTGSYNSAQGASALFSNTTGSYNSAQGASAGRYTAASAANATSSYCTMLGNNTRVNASGDTNETSVGNGAIGIGSNTVTLGNAAVTQTRAGGIISTVNGGISTGWVSNALSAGHDSSGHTSWIQSGDTGGTDLRLNPVGGDVRAGGDLYVATGLKGETSLWYHYRQISALDVSTGSSGATFVAPDSDTLGGYRLDAVAEHLYFGADIHDDWDAASDVTVEVYFEVNIDNTSGGTGDTVDLQLLCYLKGDGETATKLQTLEVATEVGQSARYKQFHAEFDIDYDHATNPVQVGDLLSMRINLETDTSEVDDIIVNHLEFKYKSAQPNAIEV